MKNSWRRHKIETTVRPEKSLGKKCLFGCLFLVMGISLFAAFKRFAPNLTPETKIAAAEIKTPIGIPADAGSTAAVTRHIRDFLAGLDNGKDMASAWFPGSLPKMRQDSLNALAAAKPLNALRVDSVKRDATYADVFFASCVDSSRDAKLVFRVIRAAEDHFLVFNAYPAP